MESVEHYNLAFVLLYINPYVHIIRLNRGLPNEKGMVLTIPYITERRQISFRKGGLPPPIISIILSYVFVLIMKTQYYFTFTVKVLLVFEPSLAVSVIFVLPFVLPFRVR